MEPHSTSIVKDAAEGIRVALSEPKPSDVGSAEYAAWQTKRMALVAAHLQQAFASEGWASVYVGGGVLQFHLAGMGYQTADIDMAVAQRTGTAVPRATLGHVFEALGGRSNGARHWCFGDEASEILVEVPSSEIPYITDRVQVDAGLVLTMDPVEHVIAGRVTSFHNTGNADHALQAIMALRALRGRIDQTRFDTFIEQEAVRPAAEIIQALADRPGHCGVELIAFAYDVLNGRRPPCDLRDPSIGPRARLR